MKFQPFILSVLGFAYAYVSHIYIVIILYEMTGVEKDGTDIDPTGGGGGGRCT
jgi:hypothetical protein